MKAEPKAPRRGPEAARPAPAAGDRFRCCAGAGLGERPAGLETGPDRGLLGGGERRWLHGLGDGLTAGRDGVGDGGHRARLVQGLQRQGGHRGGDVLQLGHVGHGLLREGDERAVHEEVVAVLRPGRSELGQVGQDRGVVAGQRRAVGVLALLSAPPAKNPPPPRPPPPPPKPPPGVVVVVVVAVDDVSAAPPCVRPRCRCPPTTGGTGPGPGRSRVRWRRRRCP